MAFDWSQLITPAVITATGGGLAKLLTNLLNHKSTSNFENQTKELTAVIEKGNAEIKGAIEGGNSALVSAIKELTTK
jgi:hypothetical protein